MEEGPQLSAAGHLADNGAFELPLAAHVPHVLVVLERDRAHHPLLALGDHDLDGLEAGLAERHTVEVHVDARPGAASHLRERRGEAGSA
jgi:hypothetical protein